MVDIAISMKLLSTWHEFVIGAIKEAFPSCPLHMKTHHCEQERHAGSVEKRCEVDATVKKNQRWEEICY